MAGDLAASLRVIVDAPQIVAVGHRREGAIQRKDFQTMTRQIEFANDLRTQERDDVRANRKLEAGKDFFRDGRAAEYVTALEHQNLLAGARKIGGVDQTVVAAANDDDVVLIIHLLVGIACLLKIASILIIARPDKHDFEIPHADRNCISRTNLCTSARV